jgi:glycosyltransferase involved in cell wall biosynthesis
MSPKITAMIFTLNEAVHLPSCLRSLQWCDDVIVVDSFSSDETGTIARRGGARLFQHTFTGFGDQRNWALDNCAARHQWVLILDADERVPAELADEMMRHVASAGPEVGAFRLRRRFFMWGRWLRYSSLYPTWVVRLVHKDRIRYVNRGHAETQDVQGLTVSLQNDLIDENLKGIDEWFERQNRYSSKDAAHELAMERNRVDWQGLLTSDASRRRASLKQIAARLPARPLAYFLYSYFWRRGFLDGMDGLQFCLMKALYQRTVALKKYDMKRALRT